VHPELAAMSARHDTLADDQLDKHEPDRPDEQPAAHLGRSERDQVEGADREAPGRDRGDRDRAGPARGRHDHPPDHPTAIAPLADLIGRTRFIVLVAVISVILVSIALFFIGAGLAVKGVWNAILAVGRGDFTATPITVDLLEVVSVMLKAVVFFLIGVGFYSLFIAPLNLTTALGIRSFNDLEIKVVSVVVVIMAVTYLEHFIRWDQAVETLLYGLSLGVVVAALVFFQMHSHREARQDEQEDAPMRARAQRELFHEREEEREVRPEEAVASRRADGERSE
jgi:uncharacterized membrane protein YqhA